MVMAAEKDDRSWADASVSELHGGEEMTVAGGEGCHGNGRKWCLEIFCGDGDLFKDGNLNKLGKGMDRFCYMETKMRWELATFASKSFMRTFQWLFGCIQMWFARISKHVNAQWFRFLVLLLK